MNHLEALMEAVQEAILAEMRRFLETHSQHKSTPLSDGATSSSLDRFRHSVKVEKSPFNGEELVVWITRAETFLFEVQRVFEVHFQLNKLNMEGQTIHWFNLWRESMEFWRGTTSKKP